MDATPEKLLRAFPPLPFRGRVVRPVHPSWPESEERHLEQWLGCQLWTEVTEEEAREVGDGHAIGFLSAEGFYYYLPAFLSLALKAKTKEASWP